MIFLAVPVHKSIYAAPSYQERGPFVSIEPEVANEETNRVTLTIKDIWDPPTPARWYKSDGTEVSPGCPGQTLITRLYLRESGFLIGTEDYFYVQGCGREPGDYYVELTAYYGVYKYEINRSFSIQGGAVEQNTIFLPLVLK